MLGFSKWPLWEFFSEWVWNISSLGPLLISWFHKCHTTFFFWSWQLSSLLTLYIKSMEKWEDVLSQLPFAWNTEGFQFTELLMNCSCFAPIHCLLQQQSLFLVLLLYPLPPQKSSELFDAYCLGDLYLFPFPFASFRPHQVIITLSQTVALSLASSHLSPV